MSEKSLQRLDWIDVAKGIGILLVVLGHLLRGLVSAGILAPNEALRVIDSVIYSFHMPLFFFLAGIFFDESITKRGVSGVIWSKVETLFYPYVIWSLIQGSVEVALARYTNGSETVADVLSLLWEPRAQFWFLYALFQIFIVSSIFLSFKSRWISYSFVAIGTVLFWLGSSEHLGPFIHASRMLIFFVLGVLFFRLGGLLVNWSVRMLVFTLVVFIAAEYFYHQVYNLSYADRSPFSLALACGGIVATIALANSLSGTFNKAFAYLGRMSMYIYLMHILAASGMRVILMKTCPDAPISIHIAAGLVAGIFVPLVIGRLCERFGLMFLFKMPRRSKDYGRSQ